MRKASGQARVLLNGRWGYLPDPRAELAPADLPRTGWEEMPVPSNWCLQGLADHSGVVWFRRRFAAGPRGEEYWLRFQGVDYSADVWLNGAYLGSHRGYFQPFEFRVTEHLLEGENELLVRVDSPREEPGTVWPDHKRLIKGVLSHHDCRPGAGDVERGQDMNTGGIWGDVELHSAGPVWISKLWLTPRLLPSGKASVLVEAELECALPAMAATVDITLQPEGFEGEEALWRGRVELTGGRTRLSQVVNLEQPSLWWTWDFGPQHLYRARLDIEPERGPGSSREERFGVREVVMDHQQGWQLNALPYFPRGTNIIPTQWLSTYDVATLSQDMELLRGAGVNAVRVHAHVTHPRFYRACDEAGILVWQDFPLQWGYEDSGAFRQDACEQLRGMIKVLGNHPSIAVWCCHNEPPEYNRELDGLLWEFARAEDPARHTERSSAVSQHVYAGWYRGQMAEYATRPGAPLITEFGAQALPSEEAMREMLPPEALWPPDWDAWAYHGFQHNETFNVARIPLGESLAEFIAASQDYQHRLLKYAIEQYRAGPEVRGLFQFMFVDPWPGITWSVVDWRRRPKKGYLALQMGLQPVLVGFQGVRHRHSLGVSEDQLFESVFIANSLPQEFSGTELHLSLTGLDGRVLLEEQVEVDVPPSGLVQLTTARLLRGGCQLRGAPSAGQYVLAARLLHGGACISQNDEHLSVVRETDL
ncbi:MAG: glycoside hydrolase family 2 TIM barrel-domain containing protein [Candidatus Bipolaricaulota bacterium]